MSLTFNMVGSGSEQSGSVSVESLSVSANGTYIAPSGTAYSPVAVNVPSSSAAVEKDVNFIDYDGTILYSYTTEEANALTALPSNPSHAGLTAQGWNWTLTEIQSQLADVGGTVWVGQMYVTESGNTEIDINLADPKLLSPTLSIAVNGTVFVNWGDGTNSDSMVGDSDSTAVTASHSYASVGEYTISISVISGRFTFYTPDSESVPILKAPHSSSRAYSSSIYNVRIGNNAFVSSRAFYNCYSLQTITIPSSVTDFSNFNVFYNCHSLHSVTIPSGIISYGGNIFDNCYSLRLASIPTGITNVRSYMFGGCHSLQSITLPSSVTNMDSYAFQACYSLRSVVIPESVTSIGTNVFEDCYALQTVKMLSLITSVSNYAFNNCRSLTSIVIPSGVTSIGNYALSNCYSLLSATIPSTVTSIGYSAFQYSYVAEYHLKPTTPPTLANANAINVISGAVIYVPVGSLSVYQSATYWSTYASQMQEEQA